jgi:hypothetical protein
VNGEQIWASLLSRHTVSLKYNSPLLAMAKDSTHQGTKRNPICAMMPFQVLHWVPDSKQVNQAVHSSVRLALAR